MSYFSPFTYGIEFESALDLQYTDVNLYERKTIFKSGNLEATVEEFDKDIFKLENCNLKDKRGEFIVQKFDKPCPYNLEISIGVYRYDNMEDFLKDTKGREYHESMIADMINYRDFIEEKIKNDNIRRLACKRIDQYENFFKDCNLKKPYTKKSAPYQGLAYKRYSPEEFNFDELEGKPQITIGISYLWFLPIYEYFMAIKPSMKYAHIYTNQLMNNSYFNEIKKKDPVYYQTIKGFLLVIVSYCNNLSIFIEKRFHYKGQSYFKSVFPLKPRSNLVPSLIALTDKYPQIFKDLKNIFQIVQYQCNDILGFEKNIKDITNQEEFYEYKNNLIQKYVKQNNIDLEEPEEKSYNHYEKNQYYMAQFFDGKNTKAWNEFVNLFTKLNILFLLERLINYQSYKENAVVIIKDVDMNRIGKDCYIKSGYYYQYDQELMDYCIKDKIFSVSGFEVDEKGNVVENNKEGAGHFVQDILDIPKLYKKGNKICATERKEIFEYIDYSENIIFEIRAFYEFTYGVSPPGLTKARELPKLIHDFLNKIREIIMFSYHNLNN